MHANDPQDEPPSHLDEPPGHWRTRNGRVLLIADMTTAHIDDAIWLFSRAGWGEHPKIHELRMERTRR